MSPDHKLREMTDADLDAFIDRSKQGLPHSIPIYSLLSIGFKRRLVDRSYTKAFIPVDEALPVFVVITGVVRKRNRQNLFVYWDPEEIPREVAVSLLASLPNWNWEDPTQFYSSPLLTLNEVERIMIGENGLCNNKLQVERLDGFCYMAKDEITTPRIPDQNFVLAPLTEDDAILVHTHWKYNFNDTVEGIRGYLKSLPSLAAFVKINGEENELENGVTSTSTPIENWPPRDKYKPVSWSVCRHCGEMGFTSTLPEYRNKKISSVVISELTKRLREVGISTFVNICGYNPPAIKSHLNVGFSEYCPIGYHIYLPEGMQWKDF